MADFWKWEADPLFAAAEDVQDSSDRLESAYRTCLHATRWLRSTPDDSEAVYAYYFRKRELVTALGTAKWQLEEFERAISEPSHSGDAARRRQFVEVIGNKISGFEKAMLGTANVLENSSLGLVNLVDDDKGSFAKFLCGTNPLESPVASSMQLNIFGEGQSKVEKPAVPSAIRESGGDVQLTPPIPASAVARIITEVKNTSSGSLLENPTFQTKNVGCLLLDPPGKREDTIVDIQFERKKNAYIQQCLTDRDPDERFISHDSGSTTPIENTNEQHRSVTVCSGLNRWKVEALPWKSEERFMNFERNTNADNCSSLWALFSKKKRPMHMVRKNCFKRWKDGDDDSNKDFTAMSSSSDHMNVLEGTNDWPNKRLLNCFASSLTFASEERSSQWFLQRALHLIPLSLLASAVLLSLLVSLGFMGLLSLFLD